MIGNQDSITINIGLSARDKREVALAKKEAANLGAKLDTEEDILRQTEAYAKEALRRFRHPVTKKAVRHQVRRNRDKVVVQVYIEEAFWDTVQAAVQP